MNHQRIKGTILTILLGIFITYLPHNWDYIKGEGLYASANSNKIPNNDLIIKELIEEEIQETSKVTKNIKVLGAIDHDKSKFVLSVREDNHRVQITELRKEINGQYKVVKSVETVLPVVAYHWIDEGKEYFFIGGLNLDKKTSYIQFQTEDWEHKFDVNNKDMFFTSIEVPNTEAVLENSDLLKSYNYVFFDHLDRNITLNVVTDYKNKWEMISHD